MKNNKYTNYHTRAIFVPGTIDENNRSVEGVLTTETPVFMIDYKRWEYIREVLLVEGMQKVDKVPLLDAHKRYNSDNVIGSATDFRVEEAQDGTKQIICINTFSETENKLFKKVREGHIDSTSVGYQVDDNESVTIPPGESFVINGKEWNNEDPKIDLVIRKKWKIKENSLVPIGADERAKLRAEAEYQKPKIKIKEVAASPSRLMQMNNNIYKFKKLN